MQLAVGTLWEILFDFATSAVLIRIPWLSMRKQIVDKGVTLTYNIVGTSSSIKGNTNIDRKWNERLQIKIPDSLLFKLFSNPAN